IWKWEGMSLNYMDVISVVGSLATALALIWALVQHRIDYAQMSKQLRLDNKRFANERSEFLETQIALRINRLTDITNQYTEIYLVAEKLKWTLQSMKDRVEQEEKLNINDYDDYFKKLSNILSDIQPWQQAIIGDLPIDPMINGYYGYYNYTKPQQLIEWIENFEEQIEIAADDASRTSENAFKLIESLREKQEF